LEVIARPSSGRAAELDQRATDSDIDLGPVAGLHDPGTVEVISGRDALFARVGALGLRVSAVVSPGSTMSRPRPRSMAPS
jgi:hypothetical protein